ncbi:MAG: threonine synthase, partial [Candidatus Ranarchaeia archaeon]
MSLLPTYFECLHCGKTFPTDEIRYTCSCGSILDIKYDFSKLNISRHTLLRRPFNVWRYRELLPVECKVTFNEGGTGLHKCTRLGSRLGLKELYVKNEGENPTGSFKDRGMTVGVSKAIVLGASIVGCASTGNTSASLAAYSARAGIKCAVFIPAGKIAMGKLTQALMYGGIVCAIQGNFDDAMEIAKTLGEQKHIYLLNSINPYRL